MDDRRLTELDHGLGQIFGQLELLTDVLAAVVGTANSNQATQIISAAKRSRKLRLGRYPHNKQLTFQRGFVEGIDNASNQLAEQR